MDERRRTPRWRLAAGVKAKELEPGQDFEELSGQGVDVSMHGVSFFVEKSFPVEALLELVVELPDKYRFICVKGKVVWQKSAVFDESKQLIKIGFDFDAIVDTDKEKIMEYAYQFCREDVYKKWWEGLEPRKKPLFA